MHFAIDSPMHIPSSNVSPLPLFQDVRIKPFSALSPKSNAIQNELLKNQFHYVTGTAQPI